VVVYDTIVAGAGPAGLACALCAAEEGTVLLIEKNPDPGRKLRLSGSGKCNITHGGDIRSFFTRYGDHGAFLKPALLNFSNCHLIALLESYGIRCGEEPDGKVFPESRRAADVLNALLVAVQESGAVVRYSDPVQDAVKKEEIFKITTAGKRYDARALVIATGGKSYPGTGSTGDGYRLAEKFGHSIIAPAPALTPVFVASYPFSDLTGISFSGAELSLFREGKKVRSHAGDLLLTHTGLSGPAILDFSRYIRSGDILRISFLPKEQRDGVSSDFSRTLNLSGTKMVKTVLAGYRLPERFLVRILEIAGIPPGTTCAHLSESARKRLIASLTDFPFTVSRLGGFDEAMVTSGGVSLAEINQKTMESRLVPGLYFAGEVLDIDGDTGGFNLQAAFSTGVLAGSRLPGKM
jgi:predicted Rossmann fold flavoprotein